MRLTDLLMLPLAALWQQKLRTILTTLGVVFGAFVLAASLSIGEGVQETINRESRRNNISRKITVFARWEVTDTKAGSDVEVEGRMSPERHDRIKEILREQARAASPERILRYLSGERLGKLAAMPHVTRVIPSVNDGGQALLVNRLEDVSISSGAWEDEDFPKRIIAGPGFSAPDQKGVILNEMFAYRMGLRSDSDLMQLIGKPLRLEIRGREDRPGFDVSIHKTKPGGDREENLALRQLAWQLPDALDKLDLTDREIEVLRKALEAGPEKELEVVSGDFPVVGVYRRRNEEELKDSRDSFHTDSDLILPVQTAVDFYSREPGRRERGISQAVLIVDDEKNVKDTIKLVKDSGLDARSAIEYIERERLTYILIFGGMTCVAGVALLVSALGIANTMLMSVLERKREIGIMKAVGADNRHLLCVFVVEGGLIGLVGSAMGLLLAWSASFPGDTWVRSMVMRDMKIDLKGSIFAFPTWIGATVLIFTVVVTTLSALYPARHAARVDPVTALRHE